MVFGYVSWKTLCEQVKLKALVQMQIEPHIDEPPGASQVADRLAEQEFPSHLVKEVVGCTKQVSAEGESATIGQIFSCR